MARDGESESPATVKGNEVLPRLDAQKRRELKAFQDGLRIFCDVIGFNEAGQAYEHKDRSGSVVAFVNHQPAVRFLGKDSWQTHPYWAALEALRFHCGGRIFAFPAQRGEHPFDALFRDERLRRPQLLIDNPLQSNNVRVMSKNVVIMPVHVDSDGRVRVLMVKDINKSKERYAFVGGGIQRGQDNTVLDAARRELQEEINCPWKDIVRSDTTPKVGLLNHRQNVGYGRSGVAGLVHPATAVIVRVKDEFYHRTSSANPFKIPDPKGPFFEKRSARPDDWKRIHTEGITFKEHAEAVWCEANPVTGAVMSPRDEFSRNISPCDRALLRANINIVQSWQ